VTDSNITAVVRAVQDLVLSISGIASAPDFPPESPNVFPFVVCYPSSGNFGGFPTGTMTGLHNVIVELHINRKNMPLDMEKLQTYIEAIPKKLLGSPTLSGTVQTYNGINYSINAVTWANVETVAVIYTINNLKIQETL